MNKQEVIEMLHNGTVILEFEKVDGSIRRMSATLKEEWLPEIKNTKPKPKNPDVLAVYEVAFPLYESGWKSFRWDRLKMVENEKYDPEPVMPLDIDFWKNRM